jgi:hypothetical protein
LHADNRYCIGSSVGAGSAPSGDTIQINVFVSFSNGDSWFKVMQLKDLKGGPLVSGGLPLNIDTSYIVPLAPRIKVQAVIRASDSLGKNHGCKVDLVFDEMYSGAKRATYIEDVKTRTYGFVGDTKTFGAADTWPRYSPALDCGFYPSRIFVWAHSDSVNRFTQSALFSKFSYELQSSSDGVNFQYADSLKVAAPASGRGDTTRCLFKSFIFMGAEELVRTSTNPSYFSTVSFPAAYDQIIRLKMVADSRKAGVITRGHGTRFHLVAFE